MMKIHEVYYISYLKKNKLLISCYGYYILFKVLIFSQTDPSHVT